MFQSKFKKVSNISSDRNRAVLVSFFGGADQYRNCAVRLAQQCEEFGVEYDISEYTPSLGENWINVCRKKISYYTGKLQEYCRPILWVDVDAQMLSYPQEMLESTADFGAFLRNFKYLIGFDPVQWGRMFHPGYVFLSNSNASFEFVKHLSLIDRAADPLATDDYVLQEALSTYGNFLGFSLFSPRRIVTSNEAIGREHAYFQHSDSGHVQIHRDTAAQHEAQVFDIQRQVRLFNAAASDEIKAGNLKDAAVHFKRIRKLDPTNIESLTKLLSIYDKLGETKKYYYHLDKSKKIPGLVNIALRYEIDRRFKENKFQKANENIERLIALGNQEDQDFCKSRSYRHSFDQRAQTLGIKDEHRIAMWWWERPYPGNLGDIINPYLVEKLTGIPPKFSTASPRLLAIGSIIKWARSGDMVWGSGASSSEQVINTEAQYRAVRGPLTRNLILKQGGDCPEIYGDPAWLLPKVFKNENMKRYKVGLIRHFTHKDVMLDISDDVLEIDIIRSSSEDIEEFLKSILSCECIISTSLHGVIIANAYNIPVKFAMMSASARQIHGDGMKFEDYFLSVGRKSIKPLDLYEGMAINSQLSSICTDNPERGIDTNLLLSSAPFVSDQNK